MNPFGRQELILHLPAALERALIEFLRSKTRPAARSVISVVAVKGRTNMAPVVDHAPDMTLSATQKVTLSIAPVKSDGTAYDGPVSWSSSDPTALPVTANPADNGRSADVSTPLANGSGTITVSAPDPDVRNADIKITYTEPVQGKMNLSAGLPQED